MKSAMGVVFMLMFCAGAWAASPWAGNWVLRDPTSPVHTTMKLEETSSGWKITYHIATQNAQGKPIVAVMTVETALDGKDSENLLDDKPSGQTMAIRKVDERHTCTIIKMNGQQSGISKSELSADGKLITTQNDFKGAQSGSPGKSTQYWDRR